MKQIFRNSIHINSKSHDCSLVEIEGKKVKITYEAYNAQEKCNAEVFDGHKWNHIFSILDLGIIPNNSAYIWDEKKRKEYSNELFKKMEILCKRLLIN
jgi:hypothetical protein